MYFSRDANTLVDSNILLLFPVPKVNAMEKRAGKEMEAFKSVIFPYDYDPAKAGGKRKVHLKKIC